MDQNKISKDFQLSEDDYLELCKSACQKINAYYILIMLVTVIVAVCVMNQIQVIGAEIIPAEWLEKMPTFIRSVIIPLLPCALLFIVFFTIYKFFMKSSKFSYVLPEGNFLRPKTTTIDEVGITEETELGMSHTKWQGVLRIENAKAVILLYVDRMSAYVVPKKGFATPDEAEAFYKQSVTFWENARNIEQKKNPWARSVASVNPSIPEQAP